MSMGYDPDDPRGENVRHALEHGLYRLQPGQKPNTNGYGPQPNVPGDKRGRFLT